MPMIYPHTALAEPASCHLPQTRSSSMKMLTNTGLFATFGGLGCCQCHRRSTILSEDDSAAEQGKTGSPIHLSLQHLQPVVVVSTTRGLPSSTQVSCRGETRGAAGVLTPVSLFDRGRYYSRIP